ncbi:hypothetical protein GCM10025876_04870 [Demequina litorisediminis]|uniref:Uncharacterized protein n=1 Tax=Demequina litorisediminis TaxID=1849022 RepID=A0ABQ6I8W8_9MICO|nr:hypothetical protein GCM10025876_04870 [Demequina litorisediminis]
MSRAQLFSAIQVAGLTTFSEIIERFGTGHGCDICKPTIGSILASIYNGHVLAEDRAALQDTNDRVMANMQKDGTYSVVPRIPGGEITPEKAHGHRGGRQGLRALHEDHGRPAHRPVRRAPGAACRRSGSDSWTRAWNPVTHTASRCVP